MKTCKWSALVIIVLGIALNRPLLTMLGVVMVAVVLFVQYQHRTLESRVERETAPGE